MGVKEDGLLMGTYIFAGIFAVFAIILGQYAYWTSKDRFAAGANQR